MLPGMGRTCGSIIPHHQPSGLDMARAAPSCTLTSQKHRTVILWSEDTEGKTPLQPLKITEASLASPQVLSLPPLKHYLTFYPRTPKSKHPPSSFFDFPPLNTGVKISSCEGSGTGNTRNTRN